jgi:sec-independent protein translocase protein TatB
MFDMGFTELMIIGIVALIVIGPERLPGVARTAGKYLGKLRRFMTDVKADVESELRADELREMLSKQQDEIQSLKEVVGDVAKEVDVDVGSMEAEIDRAAEEYQKKAAKTGKGWSDDINQPGKDEQKSEAAPDAQPAISKATRPKSVKKSVKRVVKKASAKARPKTAKKSTLTKKATSTPAKKAAPKAKSRAESAKISTAKATEE